VRSLLAVGGYDRVQRFQKLYEAAEREASVEKRQLTLLHQQRVQADIDDRKRRLLQKYVEAVGVEQQDIDVSCNHTRQVSPSDAEHSTRQCCYSLVGLLISRDLNLSDVLAGWVC